MATIQPLRACCDPGSPDETMAMIGAERFGGTNAFRRLPDAGALLREIRPGGDDAEPVRDHRHGRCPRSPCHRGRAEVLLPEERLEEAVTGHATGAAAACWRGGFSGRLAPGFSAHLLLPDRDIFGCDPMRLRKDRCFWRF